MTHPVGHRPSRYGTEGVELHVKIVLVVEDDADVRELITWKLTQAGYGTLAEADGAAGLAAASGASATAWGVRPDLVLLDWSMPKMSGIDVCLALRADPETAGLPVIVLTAKAQKSDIERGLAAGADDYIVKPFSLQEVLARVEHFLAEHEAEPEAEPEAEAEPRAEVRAEVRA